MEAVTSVAPVSQKLVWAGWVLSVLPIPLLVMSGVMKLVQPADLVTGFEHMGWPLTVALSLGVVELSCVVLYVIPQTAVLGAILLTGYLGGAIATHVRIGEGFIAPALLGVLIWGGLYLRDARLRALLPLRS